MKRKENNNNMEEQEESLRKKFKSNDENGQDDDEPIGENEEEENLEEPMSDTDMDLNSEQSKHEQLFGIKARINNDFKRFQAVLKKMFVFVFLKYFQRVKRF